MSTTADKIKEFMVAAGCKKIRHSGVGDWVGTCPFHDSRDGTQFAMDQKTGVYICYSARCGAQGNLFSFLTEALDMDPKRAMSEAGALDRSEALAWSEEEGDILGPYAERTKREVDPKVHAAPSPRLLILYNHCPTYMLKRGFTKETLRTWQIGFDKEEQRVTFPVFSPDKTLVGFSKRGIWKEQMPKYLHLGFSKSNYLYGEQLLPHPIKRSAYHARVAEGQPDAMALYQMGADPIRTDAIGLSTMGTRVSQHQIKLLSSYKTVSLCFDNPEIDADGASTTMSVGDQLVEKMGPERVFVSTYPSLPLVPKDPGDVLQMMPDPTWERAFRDVPFDEWRIDQLICQGRRNRLVSVLGFYPAING